MIIRDQESGIKMSVMDLQGNRVKKCVTNR